MTAEGGRRERAKQEGKERTGGTEERRATTVVRLEGKDVRPLLRQSGRREDVKRLRFPQNGCFNGPLQSSRAVRVCVLVLVHVRADTPFTRHSP